MNNTILLAGASGFIGSHLAAKLVSQGHNVRCLHRPTSDIQGLHGLPVELVQVEPLDCERMIQAVSGVDTVYNLAGLTAGTRSQLWNANVDFTRNLLSACSRQESVPTVVHVSSLAAAGPSKINAPRRACDPCRPVSDYGRSKLAGEEAALRFADRMPISVVRPAAVFGPGDRAFVQLFSMIRALRCHLLLGFHDPPISMIHVDDLNDILIRTANDGSRLRTDAGTISDYQCESGIYFASHPKPVSFRQLGNTVRQFLGRPHAWTVPVPITAVYPFAFVSQCYSHLCHQKSMFNLDKIREGMQEAWTCSVERVMNEFRWQPTRSVEEGFRLTIQWYFDHGWLK